ncbi:MAG: 16S rRNA (uracil(1498)-N(3))-methyltransferase [Nitrospinae bacterium]|nr:16S rRNA (uracil(1498)-N(3))-methyltransferase [Nitrospinota bacterium]
MKLIFVPPFDENGDAHIAQKDIHHIKNVLRKEKGDSIVISDGKKSYSGIISTMKENEIIISQPTPLQKKRSLEITLAHSLIKAPNIELSLSKVVETGVTLYQPIISERSYMKSVEFIQKKQERLLRKIEESSKQCGRSNLMELATPISLKEFLIKEENKNRLNLFLEINGENNFRKIVDKKINVSSVSVLIGPEGGFSPQEEQTIKEAGFFSISLGKQLLRSETAAIVTTGIIQALLDN